MDVLYPEHATALSMSDLAPTPYPTLRELQNRDGEGEEREARPEIERAVACSG